MLYFQTGDQIQVPIEEELIRQVVEETLRYSAISPEADLTVVFSDDQHLHELNVQFLGIDSATDVLAFPADFTDPDSKQTYLGDVVISIPRAEAQAKENHQSVQDEILLLVVHGVLHLLGHDHAEEEEKARMWSAQTKILSRKKV